jgi:hypothetical protein
LADQCINDDRYFPLAFARAIEAAVTAPVTRRERKYLIDRQRAQITRLQDILVGINRAPGSKTSPGLLRREDSL